MRCQEERVGESKKREVGGGDHQQTPTFLCPASQQTDPALGISEGVQPVETADAKQPVRDKRSGQGMHSSHDTQGFVTEGESEFLT